MGLRNITIAQKKIRVDDKQDFDVRGLSLTDVMAAMADYGPQMALAFAKITEKGEGSRFDSATIKARIRDLAGEFPELLAAIIALGADEYAPDMVQKVKRLPLLVQVEAIEAIFGLTFQSEGDVGKFMESLTRGLVAATGALDQIRATSLDGIGGFAVN